MRREAAVIGKQYEIKGQAICAFVSLKAGLRIPVVW
jgi:acyl-coenzyme A synthetase/AMP-(fatty) acid ligase